MPVLKLTDYLQDSNQSSCCELFFNLRLEEWSKSRPWYGFQPDVLVMPIYCPSCCTQQSDFYAHCGSRLGYAGQAKCECCGTNINIADGDNIVDFIEYTAGDSSVKLEFSELYKTGWQYAGVFEELCGLDLSRLFEGRSRLSLTDTVNLLEGALARHVTGRISYVTDLRISRLPDGVNRWIELLELCGARQLYIEKLPD